MLNTIHILDPLNKYTRSIEKTKVNNEYPLVKINKQDYSVYKKKNNGNKWMVVYEVI